MAVAVEARRLGCRYGKQVALAGLDLKVQTGEIVGLFGANGAGKSTTFKILSGLLRPTIGSFTLLGMGLNQALLETSILLDPPAFYPNLTGAENLQAALAYSRQSPSREQIRTLLHKVGLEENRKRVSGYSNGMRKRLALALALAKRPRLLMLDEPTNGLDIDGVDLFIESLKEAVAGGAACLISTHEWELAERLVDRVVILHRGRVICSSALSDLVTPEDQWLIQSAEPQAALVLQATPGVSLLMSGVNPDEYVVRLYDVPIEYLTERMVAAGSPPRAVTPYRRQLAEVYRSLVQGR